VVPVIFRKGLDLKHEVAGVLAADYHSPLVNQIKTDGYRFVSGQLTIHLAREFGFCYGVDRAVDYAYQARMRFPRRQVYLTGEIIHNPHVNRQLRSQGIRFLTDPGEDATRLGPDDVVILPAFGVTVRELSNLVDQGCTLVDTTCGSVLNVWKNVKRYAQEGFTSVIHGKKWHEETRATASQALEAGGHYLVVLNHDEAAAACEYIRHGSSAERKREFLDRFASATSPDFDPDGTARTKPRADSAPSIPSAARRRTGRMPWRACSTSTASTSRWSSAGTTAATPATWRECAPGACRRTTSRIRSAWSRPARFDTGR
jgi:4-hydroxy-3-methylbut-2-en-1-yl diphosphate reductase